MDTTKLKKCADKDCQNQFTPYSTLQKYCSYTCTYKNKKKPSKAKFQEIIKKRSIKPVSDKQLRSLAEYRRIRKEWFSDPVNSRCKLYPEKKATDVHHKMGRKGFGDSWARINNISLLVDTRFWLPVSRKAHMEIEENPTWAKKMGYSMDRLKDNG